MAANVVLAPEAQDDIISAYGWYESRRVGLGEEFLVSLEACLHAIQRHPEMYGTVYGNYRRALLRRFPYCIFYEHTLGGVRIYGVFHASLHPDRWQTRMP
jgi:plasmid stabilization system protein ParE